MPTDQKAYIILCSLFYLYHCIQFKHYRGSYYLLQTFHPLHFSPHLASLPPRMLCYATSISQVDRELFTFIEDKYPLQINQQPHLIRHLEQMRKSRCGRVFRKTEPCLETYELHLRGPT